MKLPTLIWLEVSKQKKGWIWFFLLGIPAGTTLAMFLDFSIRYDYLLDTAEKGLNSWDILLIENHRILGWGIFLPMFISIIYALLYQVEESQNSWKQILSLPVRHESVFISKFLTGLLFSTILITFNMLGLLIVGKVIGFPETIEWSNYIAYVGKQVLMTVAVASIHNWLSSFYKNMIVPIVIGFAGVILSSYLIFQFPDGVQYFPYTFSFLIDDFADQGNAGLIRNSLLLMVISLALGMWQFKRKDIL